MFDAYKRTVEGPDGPMVIEEDLCQPCRRKVLFYFDHEDTNEIVAAEELAEDLHLNLTGRRRENPTD